KVDRITLLVVPGMAWDHEALGTVRAMVADGCGVAGHGWSHQAVPPANLYHRAHGALISRDQAEHLSRSAGELRRLVGRCHAWFDTIDLPEPELYVPPAWALGRLSRSDLAGLPFRWYEVLSGVLDAERADFRWMPLVGFEADTRVRALALGCTNALNVGITRFMRRPLRIAIHPQDLRLHLATRLRELLARDWEFTTVEAAMRERVSAPPPRRSTRTP
ncbi:MAG: DUF2334 domain-containing protein, partial [Gemmatimonadota bacterium]